jgi:uncharacterized protein
MAQQQQQSALLPTLTLDELSARAQTADKGYIKAYLDAGGSPTMMVPVTATDLNKTKLLVPLLHAVCLCDHKNHKDLKGSVELVVQAGVVNSTCTSVNNNSRTALMWTCEMMQCCVLPLQVLLEAGANPNIASSTDGLTALQITGFRGSLLAAQLLLSHGADPFVTDYQDQNARYHAATSGNLELLQLLMSCSGTDPAGCCRPLQGAIVNNKLQCAKWLLANGADPDAIDNQGLTQLHCAAVIPDRDSFINCY